MSRTNSGWTNQPASVIHPKLVPRATRGGWETSVSPRRCWSGRFTRCRTKTISVLCCTSALRTGVQLCSFFFFFFRHLKIGWWGIKTTDDLLAIPVPCPWERWALRSLPAQASPRVSRKKTFLGKESHKGCARTATAIPPSPWRHFCRDGWRTIAIRGRVCGTGDR